MAGRSRAGVVPVSDRPVALVQARSEWTLYWRDRNLAWHRYEDLPPSRLVQDLLDEVGSSGNPIFWG